MQGIVKEIWINQEKFKSGAFIELSKMLRFKKVNENNN
jgi:hypothetical protein